MAVTSILYWKFSGLGRLCKNHFYLSNSQSAWDSIWDLQRTNCCSAARLKYHSGFLHLHFSGVPVSTLSFSTALALFYEPRPLNPPTPPSPLTLFWHHDMNHQFLCSKRIDPMSAVRGELTITQSAAQVGPMPFTISCQALPGTQGVQTIKAITTRQMCISIHVPVWLDSICITKNKTPNQRNKMKKRLFIDGVSPTSFTSLRSTL